jgi:hypothetical protein
VARDQRNQRNQASQNQADQRTRLNAELSYQYARQVGRKKAEPGRGGLTEGDLADSEVVEPEPEIDASEHEASADHADPAQAIAPAPKRSIFELPRRDPARASLPSGTVAPGAPTGSSKPK